MKISSILKTIVFISFPLWSLAQHLPIDLDPAEFKNPPSSVRVHTWWHWLDGRITREGITKDLESMKQQGITQATILNAAMGVGRELEISPVIFNSPEWYELFRWSLQEANRLGITIGIHNCDGWSESGGPWITPAMSMKKFVFAKTLIRGGQHSVSLPQPPSLAGYYRDVAILAFPAGETLNADRSPYRITVNDTLNGSPLTDGNPESMMEIRKDCCVKIDFGDETVRSRIALMHNFKGAFYFPGPKKIQYTLSASKDGIHYDKVAILETHLFYVMETLDFPPAKARYFKIEVSNIFNLRPWHRAALAELELLDGNGQPVWNPTVAYPLEKSGCARILDQNVLYRVNEDIPEGRIIRRNSLIDLTGKLDMTGTLHWDIPEGNWYVIRFGYTTTGAENGPATSEGRGLECDKMDTSAVNLHFDMFPRKLIGHAGQFKGNTFKFLLIDSWERGYQTWTQNMPTEFKCRRGYSLTGWIPVLCGETVESREQSEGFLYDFRKTLGELIEQNYYRHFRDLCHRNGLELHGEVIYGDTGPFPPLDVLKANSYMDMPMYEFWSEQNELSLVDYKPSSVRMENLPVYTSLFYNAPVIGAEAYTGYAHYSESPSDLKLFGDKAYCSGINQMILHSYVHQPVDREPGLTLGQHGSHFNRNNPPWQHAKGWIDYQSRIQYILQQGKMSASVLYYLGDQVPQFLFNKTIRELPEGYQSVPCNFDVLQKLSVRNGKLVYSDGQKFQILVLPDHEVMEYSTLRKIAGLVRDGAVVYGRKPLHMFSLTGTGSKKEFMALSAKVWKGFGKSEISQNRYGKGVVIWNKPIADVLAESRIVPDFTTHQSDSLNLMFLRKQTADCDIFFLVNQQDTSLARECTFRTGRGRGEIWDPLTGEVRKIGNYTVREEQVTIPVTLKPRESLFFIFRDGDSKDILATWRQKTPEVLELTDFRGRVIFYPVNSEKSDSVEFSRFRSFTEFTEPEVKYFSGTAVYRIDFDLPVNFSKPGDMVFLNVGKLDATAEIILNNQPLGTVWMPNTLIQTGNLLREKNHLEIVVGTTCRNRIIGDLCRDGTLKSLWTSAPVNNFLNKESPLKPSGILGPVQLIKY